MKIFRTNFLTKNIPQLSDSLDVKVRSSNKGGAIQVLCDKGANLRYYDVNSLYPYAMTLPMPLHYLDTVTANDLPMSTFSGFIQAIMEK